MSPAVLLHASASSGAQWKSLAGALAARDVLAPDLLGYGATPAPAVEGEFRLAEEAAALRPRLRALGAAVDLVGHSYGGAIALHLARTSPELVRRLVLIEPVAFHLLREGDAIDVAGYREFADTAAGVRRAAAAGASEAAAELFVDYWNGAGAWSALPPERRAPVLAALPKLGLEIDAVLGEPATLRDLRRIDRPVLLIQGGQTRLSTRCVCHRLAHALSDVEHRVVRGAGHMLPLTHRDEVNGLVVAFLGAQSRPARQAA